ncbi:MAG: serine/threonine-protein kinase [Myxococcota bacterium]
MGVLSGHLARVRSGTSSAVRSAEALVGHVVAGRYRLDQVIGRGAMGLVFKGLHLALGRPVAVKVLKNLRSEDAIIVTRFRREAQTAARLDHPHSVQVLDFGEDDALGFLFLVMEHVLGRPLSKVVKAEQRLPPERAVRIMLQVADALGAAHQAGVIHRDVKPSNMLVQPRQTASGSLRDFVKVCDFGLARFVNEHAGVEDTQDPRWKAAGTPIYMSPEQAVGDPLDPRTDVYSCGIVLYHLLSGRPPFLADSSVRILMMQVSKEPPPLSSELPKRLRELVSWCLAKMPEDRCPDMHTFHEHLSEVLSELIGLQTASGAWAPMTEDLVELPVVEAERGTEALPLLPLDALQPLEDGLDPADATDPRGPAALNGGGDIEALVAEAVAEVTGDLQGSQGGQVQGLDVRRQAATVPDLAAYLYTHYGITHEPYSGPYPFFARDHRGELLGPMSHQDLWLILKRSADEMRTDKVLVSGDAEQWVAVPEYVKWIGQESMLDADDRDREQEGSSTWLRGPLDKSSVIQVLTRVAREGGTGRLRFHRNHYDGQERIEVHLIQGKPTFVYSSDAQMQIPQLLVKKGLLPKEQLLHYLHRCLTQERSLEELLSRELHIDMKQWRSAFMKERLLQLFSWSSGEYRLDDDALPAAVAPFSDSLLAVLRDLVHRAVSEERILHRIQPVLDFAPLPSEWIREGLAEMRLTEAQSSLLRRVFKAKTIREGLEQDPGKWRAAASLVYLLVEAGLLLEPIH